MFPRHHYLSFSRGVEQLVGSTETPTLREFLGFSNSLTVECLTEGVTKRKVKPQENQFVLKAQGKAHVMIANQPSCSIIQGPLGKAISN